MTNALATFRHEALLYARPDEFVTRVGSFVADGVDAGEPVLVVVSEPKIRALQDVLGSKAVDVHWANMANVGRNPGRILPAWHDFVDVHHASGRSVRGVGEPIDMHRDADALTECHRHEALLNVAFADSAPWWLVCPYDTSTLSSAVLDEARRNHPFVSTNGTSLPNPAAVPVEVHARPFDTHLDPPPEHAVRFEVHDAEEFHALRESVVAFAGQSGVGADRVGDIALVVDELVANGIRHGSNRAEVRAWTVGDALVYEVRDGGRIRDPLAGRRRPSLENDSGRGLWIVHQLSDLVQQRTLANQTVTRVRFAITG